jgi:hypothetical protein
MCARRRLFVTGLTALKTLMQGSCSSPQALRPSPVLFPHSFTDSD